VRNSCRVRRADRTSTVHEPWSARADPYKGATARRGAPLICSGEAPGRTGTLGFSFMTGPTRETAPRGRPPPAPAPGAAESHNTPVPSRASAAVHPVERGPAPRDAERWFRAMIDGADRSAWRCSMPAGCFTFISGGVPAAPSGYLPEGDDRHVLALDLVPPGTTSRPSPPGCNGALGGDARRRTRSRSAYPAPSPASIAGSRWGGGANRLRRPRPSAASSSPAVTSPNRKRAVEERLRGQRKEAGPRNGGAAPPRDDRQCQRTCCSLSTKPGRRHPT